MEATASSLVSGEDKKELTQPLGPLGSNLRFASDRSTMRKTPGTSGARGFPRKRATGFEPATLSLGS